MTTQTPPKPSLKMNIIGDAFVDIYCYLSPNQSLPTLGGDSRLSQPIHSVAGGSALNTCTHYQALAEEEVKVELQTVMNEEDDYGKVLLNHVQKYGFQLINCHPQQQQQQHADKESSTGHCVVIVCNNERSFMTHLGCVGKFHASHLQVDKLISSQPPQQLLQPSVPECNHHHHVHVHVAGYYNIPGFWNGALEQVFVKVKQQRQSMQDGDATTTTISLVPQHDATEEWDGDLLQLLEYVDFLILNELEAFSIVSTHLKEEEDDSFQQWKERHNNPNANNEPRNDLFVTMATFFQSYNPQMYIIVTRGPKGAISLNNGSILHTQNAVQQEDIVDPTGAGDAFAAGFLHGLFLDWKNGESECWKKAVKQGLKWGCAVGTSCVLRQGASNPSSREEIELLLLLSS